MATGASSRSLRTLGPSSPWVHTLAHTAGRRRGQPDGESLQNRGLQVRVLSPLLAPGAISQLVERVRASSPLCPLVRSDPLETALHWRSLAHNWRAELAGAEASDDDRLGYLARARAVLILRPLVCRAEERSLAVDGFAHPLHVPPPEHRRGVSPCLGGREHRNRCRASGDRSRRPCA